MIINNIDDFSKYFKNIFGKCEIEKINNRVIKIEEKEESGKGTIILNINQINGKIVKIVSDSKLNIGCIRKPKNLDGLILEVNFSKKIIVVYLIELKVNLTSKLKNAMEQISKAYWFIKGLCLDECFELEFVIVFGYKEINQQNLSNFLSNPNIIKNPLEKEIYKSLLDYLENKNDSFL